LRQAEWSAFIHRIGEAVNLHAENVHFSGFSLATAVWQNAAFIFTIAEEKTDSLTASIKSIRAEFRQDAVAWTQGITLFL